MLTQRRTFACGMVACLLFSFVILISICRAETTDISINIQNASKTLLPASLSSAPDIIVNTTSDVIDFGDGRVEDLPGPDGLVSLREAIRAANATPGPQVIGFNIPTTDEGFDGMVFTIKVKPFRPLDSLMDDGNTIDGSTQTSFTGDTNPYGPEIVINGDVDAGGGLTISSAYNVISDLVINGFLNSPHGVGIKHGEAYRAHHNLVTRCYIGLNATGGSAIPNDGEGVSLGSAAENNMIINNVISGNKGDGISFYEFQGLSTQNNVIQGNYIGTDPTGTNLIGNGRCGIGINLKDFPGFIDRNIIGGTEIGEGNIIMGNNRGICITTTDVDGNIIQGNIISKNGTGIQLGGPYAVLNHTIITENMITENTYDGIAIQSSGNQVLGNVIAYNGDWGLFIFGLELKNRVSQNSIFSNGYLGIDLGGDGVTLNDPGDVDSGPNEFMNFPVLESAKATHGRLIVKGTIDTHNPKDVTIEFFANPVPVPGGDPSGHGEGAVFLGTDRPNPKGKFTATLPPVDPGTLITATATDAFGNTSEFAANIVAVGPGK